MAIPLWLKTVRSLLRDLKLTDCTRPHPAQLEHLRVTIHPCNEASDPNHRPCVSKFIEDARQVAQTRSMAALFSLPLSTRFRSEYLSSLLMEWVEDIFSKQIAPRVLRVERSDSCILPEERQLTQCQCRTPKMRIPNDSYSLLQAEMMARVPTQFPGDCMDISVVIRKELMPEAITSAELYALLWMASDRVRREPRQSKIKVNKNLAVFSININMHSGAHASNTLASGTGCDSNDHTLLYHINCQWL